MMDLHLFLANTSLLFILLNVGVVVCCLGIIALAHQQICCYSGALDTSAGAASKTGHHHGKKQ